MESNPRVVKAVSGDTRAGSANRASASNSSTSGNSAVPPATAAPPPVSAGKGGFAVKIDWVEAGTVGSLAGARNAPNSATLAKSYRRAAGRVTPNS